MAKEVNQKILLACLVILISALGLMSFNFNNAYISGKVTTCADQCSPVGQISCLSGSQNTVRFQCINNGTGFCNELSYLDACSAGQKCQAGACVTCTDECSTGQIGCVSSTQKWSCGNNNADTCKEKITSPCYSGQTCQEGNCVTSCINECSTNGANECTSSTQYRTCGNYDTDTCLEWSTASNCATGQTCSNGNCAATTTCIDECTISQQGCLSQTQKWYCGEANDGDTCKDKVPMTCPSNLVCYAGYCTGASCVNQCTALGSTGCSSSTQSWICGVDINLCLVKDYTNCPTGQTCSNGLCITASCKNDCSPSGTKQCSSGTQYKTCGNYDTDTCLEWSSTTNCPTGQICQQGKCSTCINECYTGSRRCSGSGYQTCGNYDSDPCLEYSTSVTACPTGQTCIYSVCSPPCTNECTRRGAIRCYSSSAYQTCGNYDADACLEWSSTTTSCLPGKACINNYCQ